MIFRNCNDMDSKECIIVALWAIVHLLIWETMYANSNPFAFNHLVKKGNKKKTHSAGVHDALDHLSGVVSNMIH